MSWTTRFAQWSFAVSGLCLIVGILMKLAGAEVAGISVRSLYAMALILGVYSIAFSMCGLGESKKG